MPFCFCNSLPSLQIYRSLGDLEAQLWLTHLAYFLPFIDTIKSFPTTSFALVVVIVIFLSLTVGTLTSSSLLTSLLPYYCHLCGPSSEKFPSFSRPLALSLRSRISPFSTTICLDITGGSVSELSSELSTMLLNVSLYQLEIAKISDFFFFLPTAFLRTRFLEISRI